MREIPLPPRAAALLDSLRAIGYSFDSALADIIDNSLAAQSTRVDLQFRTGRNPYVAIIDDGTGMAPDGLIQAMQLGGVGPEAERAATDLGRFGLGLKTASFSQCQRLTVVTSRNGVESGATWDLTRVRETGDWTIGSLDPAEISATPHIDEIRTSGHGSVVVWEDLDRALGGEANPGDALARLMDKSRSRLGFVFHRWLKAEPGQPRVALWMNGIAIEASDPFLAGTSTEMPLQRLKVEGHEITFTPFILPHRSRLTKRQVTEIDGEDGLRRSQGFYVYRSRRLITSGTWFRLMRQDELTKLARVRVDIPNALDGLWQLDVKKSIATPPHQVRAGLNLVIKQIGLTSRRVYTHRGWKDRSPVVRLWERLELPSGVNYKINRDHLAVAALISSQSSEGARGLGRLLDALEMTIPFDAIYADMASEKDVKPDFAPDEVKDRLQTIIDAVVGAVGDDKDALDHALRQLLASEPFSTYPDVSKRLVRDARDG